VLRALLQTAALAALLFGWLADARVRRVSGWGALWGVAAGMWLLAPRMIAAHHFWSDAVSSWTIVALFLAIVFAMLGAVLTAAGALPMAFLRRVRVDGTSAALGAALILPPMYTIASVALEAFAFNGLPPLDRYRPLGTAAIWYAAMAIALVVLRRTLTSAATGGGRVRGLLTAAAIGGVIALPVRAARPIVSDPSGPTLLAQDGLAPAPLLIIGLDGANWRTLQPLIDRHRVPTFESLVSHGVSGEVEALWPPYWSGPAWATILTGRPADEIGVHEALVGEAPGLPRFELPLTMSVALNPIYFVEFTLLRAGMIRASPAPREALLAEPVWQTLTRAGVRTAVVRFPFTFPATGQASHVISNVVVGDMWTTDWALPGNGGGLVEPHEDTERVMGVFRSSPADTEHLALSLMGPPRPAPRDANVDPGYVVARMAAIDERLHELTNTIVREDPAVRVVMQHIAGFDNVCHALWQYRFPEDFPTARPAQADIDHLGPVIDRYLESIDRRLAELIAAFPAPPNVLIVSDHGESGSLDYPLWKGWHASPGVFILAGPDVGAAPARRMVSYYDIVPTILQLQGFATSTPMRGRSVLAK
jgi:hypothetical protein